MARPVRVLCHLGTFYCFIHLIPELILVYFENMLPLGQFVRCIFLSGAGSFIDTRVVLFSARWGGIFPTRPRNFVSYRKRFVLLNWRKRYSKCARKECSFTLTLTTFSRIGEVIEKTSFKLENVASYWTYSSLSFAKATTYLAVALWDIESVQWGKKHSTSFADLLSKPYWSFHVSNFSNVFLRGRRGNQRLARFFPP